MDMDVLQATDAYEKQQGVPQFEEKEHAAISLRALPYRMRVPLVFLPWDADGGVIALRRKAPELAVCRCGFVLAGVFFVMDRASEQKVPVALKVMDRAQILAQRDDVDNEIRAMALLQMGGVHAPLRNPYMIRWESGDDHYNRYLATEFVSNGSLVRYAHRKIRALMQTHLGNFAITHGGGPTPLECVSYVYRGVGHEWMQEGVKIFEGIIRALTYMHAQDVAHLDLDIYNVAIDRFGAPRIIDLGSAQIMFHRGLVGAGDVGIKCKPVFVAPEVQAHARIPPPRPGFDGTKADLWAAGVILVQCIAWGFRGGPTFVTANPGWRKATFTHIDGHCDSQSCHFCTNFISIPPLYGAIIKKLLHIDPNCRPTAYEVAMVLQENRQFQPFQPPQHVRPR